MQKNTQAISRQALLEKANALIREHDDYFAGLEADDVIQQGDVLVFRGPFFLDDEGLPTAKTTAVFNVFKYLALTLSSRYHLA
ncbi:MULTISPECIES: YciN family protein [Pantoea]|uniref:YciN family protein n=1 Tax=Pantoea piersonii TaxID=2364647 RepID=A0AAJ5UAV9_9GAMM|nr:MULTISPECIES: YciN family protein [Pantoea]MDU6431934.1 YciN family protein [Pantoea sp.]MBZ6385659.1 YciN family protein [Pantoea piersonii]MBZ6401546.1 YciN family protein [Pantoea piersonii]MBZ6407688.1 YciN family protein [Pantoea piersonii]MBZ6425415.1 YciN family protein [Pantoea piersonii]